MKRALFTICILTHAVMFPTASAAATRRLALYAEYAPDIQFSVDEGNNLLIVKNMMWGTSYAVDVYQDDLEGPIVYQTGINNLLKPGESRPIALTGSPTLGYAVEAYSKVLPEGHRRRDFSIQVASENLINAVAPLISSCCGSIFSKKS